MPIKIPNELPAVRTLTEENIFVMTETRAITQDIRPLKLLILNLMPTKGRYGNAAFPPASNSPSVEIELMHTRTHVSRNTAEEHMLHFTRRLTMCVSRNFRRHDHHGRARWSCFPLKKWDTGMSLSRS